MRILGIESSCDETAASVVEDGVRVLSSEVATQVDVHHKYGGVVPELASRCHVEAISPVVEAALSSAGVTRNQIDAVALTQGPGLVGALLVGFSYGKAFSHALGIPWIGVNHLLGHIHSVFLSDPDPDPVPEYPFAALLVSGGHSALYHVVSPTEFHLMGQTRDDAAGEAYDKVSKMLGLGYPGGVIIDKMAQKGNPEAISFPRSWLDRDGFDFSFSGLKSAVGRYLDEHKDGFSMEDIAASFQAAVSEVLVEKSVNAAKRIGTKHLVVVGGVSANSGLRARLKTACEKEGIFSHVPQLCYCGDNAAMIAAAGHHLLKVNAPGGIGDDVYSRHVAPNRKKTHKHR